jgi:hypothetical protein
MRRSLAVAALLTGLAFAHAGATPSPRAQVHGAFRGFVRALAARDADAGIARLSAASLVEWQRGRQLALEGRREEVAALPAGRRMLVFALRHYAPAFLANDGSPRELVAHAIRAGMADRDAVSQVELSDVIFRDTRASGGLLAMGLPSTFRAVFVQEGGTWKIDLPGTLDAASRVIGQAAAASDSSEDAVIAGLLTLASGERPTTKIWTPLRR